ncbi:hypothetical protein EDC01DRAFT_626195 [Geopyxis carbonaria]|nr:hypothetical protein EDC01DRAFT_626195 [Geopyxis carbonaria]
MHFFPIIVTLHDAHTGAKLTEHPVRLPKPGIVRCIILDPAPRKFHLRIRVLAPPPESLLHLLYNVSFDSMAAWAPLVSPGATFPVDFVHPVMYSVDRPREFAVRVVRARKGRPKKIDGCGWRRVDSREKPWRMLRFALKERKTLVSMGLLPEEKEEELSSPSTLRQSSEESAAMSITSDSYYTADSAAMSISSGGSHHTAATSPDADPRHVALGIPWAVALNDVELPVEIEGEGEQGIPMIDLTEYNE